MEEFNFRGTRLTLKYIAGNSTFYCISKEKTGLNRYLEGNSSCVKFLTLDQFTPKRKGQKKPRF